MHIDWLNPTEVLNYANQDIQSEVMRRLYTDRSASNHATIKTERDCSHHLGSTKIPIQNIQRTQVDKDMDKYYSSNKHENEKNYRVLHYGEDYKGLQRKP